MKAIRIDHQRLVNRPRYLGVMAWVLGSLPKGAWRIDLVHAEDGSCCRTESMERSIARLQDAISKRADRRDLNAELLHVGDRVE